MCVHTVGQPRWVSRCAVANSSSRPLRGFADGLAIADGVIEVAGELEGQPVVDRPEGAEQRAAVVLLHERRSPAAELSQRPVQLAHAAGVEEDQRPVSFDYRAVLAGKVVGPQAGSVREDDLGFIGLIQVRVAVGCKVP